MLNKGVVVGLVRLVVVCSAAVVWRRREQCLVFVLQLLIAALVKEAEWLRFSRKVGIVLERILSDVLEVPRILSILSELKYTPRPTSRPPYLPPSLPVMVRSISNGEDELNISALMKA